MGKKGARAVLAILLVITLLPLLSYYLDGDRSKPSQGQIIDSSALVPEDDPMISEDEAIEVVLEKIPGAGYDDILEFSSSYQEGGWIYEGTAQGKRAEYEYQVDGDTGTLLKWEVKAIKH